MTDTLPAGPKPAPIPLVLPPAAFADPADAFRVFPLPQPVTLDGRTHKLIGIRRFTMAQVRAISENFRDNLARDPDARMSLPLYVDEAGNDLPPGVLDLLTPDTSEDLDEAANDFLPRRFRTAATADPGEPSPADGSSTAPSS